MGASRKLQGEIDRVLKKVQEGVELFDSIWNKVYDTDNANQKEKYEADLKKEIKKLQRYRDQIKTWIQSSEIKDKKVSASYEQALIDARKQIEREMERFKICEKETKTKAFSKEGLGQQPKTDPKEKAKSETRDWINTVVGELESQVDTFEAEMEGLSVKKGKTRPPRLVHLETSITRHKSHVMKLELILRLLDNDELSPEQVNEVKDFLDDYLERNQEDFDEFSDVDELYSSLPLVDTLEDLVTIGPPGHAKGGSGGSSILTLKTGSSSHTPAVATSPHKSVPVVEQNEEVSALDSTFDVPPRTPPSKSNVVSSSNLVTTIASHTSTGPVNIPQSGVSTSSTVTSTISSRGAPEISVPTASSSLNPTIVSKEEEVSNVPVRRPSPVVVETGLARGMGRSGITSQPAANNILGSAPPVSSGAMTLGTAPLASDAAKRNILGADERLASSVVSGRAFSPSVSPGMQWRPGSTFQNQSETGQFRGRVEIAPDQREKFLQRLQEVRQQGHSNILGMSTIGGNHKQFPGQPLQQLNSQSSSVTSQVAHSLGIHPPGLNTPTSSALQQQTSVLQQQPSVLQQQPSALQQQPSPIVQQATQQGSLLTGVKDADGGLAVDEQQQQVLSDESNTENNSGSGLSKNLMTDGDSKAIYSSKDAPAGGVSSSMVESSQLQRDVDLSPGQPLRPSGSLGVIGQRSVSDLGAIGDNLGATSSNYGVVRDQMYNYRMLEASYNKMPLPKDSERTKSYNPRHPAVTPASYPQVQVPFVNNPAFWERMAFDPVNADTLFFAFYFQPNTYQQFLAAKELKKQAWRYHRKYHTWFQRHKEPDDATDEYEKGSYVYFDCHVNEDEQGWCQRLKHDFVFEYSYLEDELIV